MLNHPLQNISSLYFQCLLLLLGLSYNGTAFTRQNTLVPQYSLRDVDKGLRSIIYLWRHSLIE